MAKENLTMKDVWEYFSSIDVNSMLDKLATGKKDKNGNEEYLNYINWDKAFAEVSKFDPEWTWKPVEFDDNGVEVPEGSRGIPYRKLEGGAAGYFVETLVTIKGFTKRMHLPIMNNNNYAVKCQSYTYKTKYSEYVVRQFDAMDLNTNLMRCFVKNIAVNFGLGWYVYAGLTEQPNQEEEVKEIQDVAIESNPITPIAEHIESISIPEIEMPYEEALTYCFEQGGKNLQGTPVLKLITNSKSPEKSMAILEKFANNGTGKDSAACKAILKALNEGLLKFPEVIEENAAA